MRKLLFIVISFLYIYAEQPPTPTERNLNIAIKFYKYKIYHKALKFFNNIDETQLHENTNLYHLTKGLTYLALHKYDNALYQLYQVKDDLDFYIRARLEIAKIYYLQKEYLKSTDEFEALLNLDIHEKYIEKIEAFLKSLKNTYRNDYHLEINVASIYDANANNYSTYENLLEYFNTTNVTSELPQLFHEEKIYYKYKYLLQNSFTLEYLFQLSNKMGVTQTKFDKQIYTSSLYISHNKYTNNKLGLEYSIVDNNRINDYQLSGLIYQYKGLVNDNLELTMNTNIYYRTINYSPSIYLNVKTNLLYIQERNQYNFGMNGYIERYSDINRFIASELNLGYLRQLNEKLWFEYNLTPRLVKSSTGFDRQLKSEFVYKYLDEISVIFNGSIEINDYYSKGSIRIGVGKVY